MHTQFILLGLSEKYLFSFTKIIIYAEVLKKTHLCEHTLNVEEVKKIEEGETIQCSFFKFSIVNASLTNS